MSKIKSYAAPQAGAELELYEYDAGELKAEDVEVQVDYRDLSLGSLDDRQRMGLLELSTDCRA